MSTEILLPLALLEEAGLVSDERIAARRRLLARQLAAHERLAQILRGAGDAASAYAAPAAPAASPAALPPAPALEYAPPRRKKAARKKAARKKAVRRVTEAAAEATPPVARKRGRPRKAPVEAPLEAPGDTTLPRGGDAPESATAAAIYDFVKLHGPASVGALAVALSLDPRGIGRAVAYSRRLWKNGHNLVEAVDEAEETPAAPPRPTSVTRRPLEASA